MSGALDELAGRLVVPDASGVYLTRSELVVLARLAEGSLRVGERRRMLVDVLRSAQSAAELVALLQRLQGFCQLHLDHYQALVAGYPTLEPVLAPWQARARATIEHLEGIVEELRAT